YARRSFAAALAVLVAAWPLHLRLSACSALENGSFLLFLLLALFLLIWRDTRDNRWLWSSACVWVWFANWRMENLAIITGVLLLSLSIEYGRVWKWWRVADFYAVGALAVLLAWPGLLCDVYGIHSHFYLTDSTSVHNSAFLGSKMAANWLFWVNNHFHPVFYTLLAAVSVFLAWNRFYMLAWLAWFVVLNVFYGFIPTADFELLYTCDSWRNSLFPTWGMLVLAADGFAMIYHRLSLRGKGWTVLWIAAFLLGVAVQPWAKYSYIAQRNTWIREFQLAERIGRRLPENADLLLSGSALRTMGNSLYIKIWDRGSSAQWHWYVLPDSAIIHAPGEPFPELLRATRTWKNDGRRIFLCISGSQKSSWDSYRWRWFNKYYDLRLLDGEAVPYEGDYITLYEIDGLTEAAERWINAGTAE
ncbi:hypothetical protein IJT17_03265, partial [bacterium]|nr:hypothetical protein [bacterium]